MQTIGGQIHDPATGASSAAHSQRGSQPVAVLSSAASASFCMTCNAPPLIATYDMFCAPASKEPLYQHKINIQLLLCGKNPAVITNCVLPLAFPELQPARALIQAPQKAGEGWYCIVHLFAPALP